MESIYSYINNNIQSNGKLKNNFNLSRYRTNNDILEYADGAEDGIILFHAIKEKIRELIKFIIKQLKTIKERTY